MTATRDTPVLPTVTSYRPSAYAAKYGTALRYQPARTLRAATYKKKNRRPARVSGRGVARAVCIECGRRTLNRGRVCGECL